MSEIKNAANVLVRLLWIVLMAVAGMQTVWADEIHIKMLDTSSAGTLAFEPGFVKANVGDTIVFEPVQLGGHSTVSLLVPPGAQAWSGAIDKQTSVRLDAEGVYLYACAAHKMMGMVGVILVGKPTNLEQARKTAAQVSSKFVFNKDRFEKEMAAVQ